MTEKQLNASLARLGITVDKCNIKENSISQWNIDYKVKETFYFRVIVKRGMTVVKFYRISISSSDLEIMVFFRRLFRLMSEDNLKKCLESEISMIPSTTIKHNTQLVYNLYLLKKQDIFFFYLVILREIAMFGLLS
jgi:hypothetical protein